MNGTSKDQYNGWPNRATWNVNLWVFNEEPSYRLWCAWAARLLAQPGRSRNMTCAEVYAFVRRLYPELRTPDGEAFRDVDWPRLANAWRAAARDLA